MKYNKSALTKGLKRRNSKTGRLFGHFMLWLIRAKIVGRFPEDKKFVLIVAPHTSNWDFVFGMFAYFAFDIDIRWLGKSSMFKFPATRIFKYWGGVPVYRDSNNDLVTQVATLINENEHFILAIAPEGTRAYSDKWKTGFYHIAEKAEVPIQCVAFDYKKRELIIGPVIRPRNKDEDFKTIETFYKKEMARNEENYNPSIY